MNAQASILAALSAALLFGASTPFAKLLAGRVPPVLLAGLLYLGSGLGLGLVRCVRDRGFAAPRLPASQWPWLFATIALGGVLGPVLLMFGLTRVNASGAALLLNLEAVFTALLAWLVFRENAGRRVILGMALIIAGGVTLALTPAAMPRRALLGELAIAAACLCWGMDNNLTRKIAAGDALFIASVKGLVAGATNLALALGLGAQLPNTLIIVEALIVGLLGYGVSLVLFVLALRGLGSARTGAYFSTAPFLGAAVAISIFHSPVPAAFWISAALMAAGVWLHLTEDHEHEHSHDALTHTHSHAHDAHHRHTHDFAWDGTEPHTHEHEHQRLRHRHAHFPDLHHRHEH